MNEAIPVADRPVSRPTQLRSRLHGWQAVLIAFVLFGILSLVVYWPIYPGDPSQIPNCGCGDAAQSTWFLAWIPFAALHGLNPFHTVAINYPLGANLAISAQMFLFGIVLLPVTYAFNAIASYNLLLWLAFTLSATSAFYVVRRWTKTFCAALVAGLFFGFSPYMVGQGLSHLNLVFVPLIPLIFLATYEIFVSQRKPILWGLILGVLSTAQYLISSEFLATTAIECLICLILFAVANPHSIVGRARRIAISLAIAVPVFLIFTAYPIWYSLYGPQHLIAPIHAFNNQFRADLLGPFLPTVAQSLYPANLTRLGTRLLQGSWYENGSYLGIPLILLVSYLVWRYRRERWILFFGLMTVLSFILSLGPQLTVNNHPTSVDLPFDLLAHFPLLDNILTSRLALFVTFFVMFIIARGVDEAVVRAKERLRVFQQSRLDHRTRLVLPSFGTTLIALVAALSFFSLIPSLPYASTASPVPNPTPKFFSSNAVSMIPVNSVVLTYPYPYTIYNEAMVWQSLSHMRFRLLGGYDLFTIPPGIGAGVPAVLEPEIVESAFSYLADGQTFPLSSAPDLSQVTPKAVTEFLDNNRVDVVIVNLQASHATQIDRLLRATLGAKPVISDDLAIWTGVKKKLATR